MYRTVLYYKTMFMKRTNKSLNHATFKDINMLKLSSEAVCSKYKWHAVKANSRL